MKDGKNNLTQVSRDHYFRGGYDDLNRFVSFYYQADAIRKLHAKEILEIGIGNGTLSSYLKNNGYHVTTCDFAKDLSPDYVADIRDLPFSKPQFDCVVAFEILEHIPFSDLRKAIDSLARTTKKYVVISVPYSSVYLEFLIRFPFIEKILKQPFLRLFLWVPFLSSKFQSREHYWELGRKGFSRKKVRNVLQRKFRIIREFRPPISPHHYFFVLRIK